MVDLWGRRWAKGELLARVGRLEQLAGVRLVSRAINPRVGFMTAWVYVFYNPVCAGPIYASRGSPRPTSPRWTPT